MRVAIYDTTLRDGTQREGISLSVADKLRVTELLDDLGVAYIEGGWPGSNPKDAAYFEAVKALTLKHAKIAAFGSTRRKNSNPANDPNIQALVDADTPVVTVVGKTSMLHVTEVLRTTPAADLIPRGCLADGRRFWVWESGGTTGTPKRIVDSSDRAHGLERVSVALSHHAFPGRAGDWLHLGPSGPHLVARSVGLLAQRHGQLCHYVDCDPRWVKRLFSEGRRAEADRYIAHVLDQAIALLAAQPVAILACTPPLLEALCLHGAGLGLLRRQVRGVIWFGTSAGEESLRLWEEELLPEACLVGWYGNTINSKTRSGPCKGEILPYLYCSLEASRLA